MANNEKTKRKNTTRKPWAWVPSLYYAEGIPYIIVMTVSAVMYKTLGISNTDLALYTSWLYLPWVIKPIWSPVVDMLKTKRFWIVTMQFVVGVGLAGIAFTVPTSNFFQYTLAFLWLLAFSSATHDIAADGFYMLGLTEHEQAFYVGIRGTFYRFAMLTGQGIMVMLVGVFMVSTGLEPVEITAKSNPEKTAVLTFNPQEAAINPKEGEMKIVVPSEEISIATGTHQKQKVDSLISVVKRWNVEQNFYEAEKTKEEKAKEESWWARNVANPFGMWIKRNFGEEEIIETGNEAGNIGLMYFHLSKAPEEDNVVVTFTQEGGDKSIAIQEGIRFTFTKENWNKPAYSVIQLDKQLDKKSLAKFEARAGNVPLAWSITFFIIAALFMIFFIYHKFILPHPATDGPVKSKDGENPLVEFFRTFAIFFKKERIGVIVAFLLLYRLAESQIVKLGPAFLLETRELGGIGLTPGELGLAYGTIGMIFLTLGGILGGILASRHGLKFWLWWFAIAMNIPNAVYIFLSYALPDSLITISAAIAIEQFGYGFGFTAYMLYMIYASQGKYKTSHFAITTGFMALGMMLPGMVSGWLQELIGYEHFFIWVMLCTIASFGVIPFLKIDPEFGKKKDKNDKE